MLDKLQELEHMLVQITNQYHIIATELANLKNKPNNDAKNEAIISELNRKLNTAQKNIGELQSTLQAQNQKLSDKTHYIDVLTQNNAQLAKENNDLKQKNHLAVERAELIQTWLANIDNATSQ